MGDTVSTTSVLTRVLEPTHVPRHLALQISERRLLLFAVDAVLLLFAGHAALAGWGVLRLNMGLAGMLVSPYASWVIALTLVWLALIALCDGYNVRVSAWVREITRCLARVCVVFVVAYVVLFFFTSVAPSSAYAITPLGSVRLLRVVPVLFVAVALPLELAWRSVYALVLAGDHFQQRILMMGTGPAGRTLMQVLNKMPGNGYQMIGYIDDDPAQLGKVIEGSPVLGPHWNLVAIAQQHGANEIVLATRDNLSGSEFQSVMDCYEQGLHITPMPLLYERLTGRVPVEHVGQQWYLSLPLSATPPSLAYRTIERAIDIASALVGLGALAVLCPLVAAGNALWSPGPLFYRQTRVGRSGKLFQVVKLRTMIPDAEKRSGAVWAQDNDPRITHFGRLLRRTRLDEVPQFWNILKGDMSLIGPRPERPEFIDELAQQVPFYRSRHVVKPGVTGCAQVCHKYGNCIEDTLIKLQYDLYYIKHQSFYLNLAILIKTVGVVLKMEGA